MLISPVESPVALDFQDCQIIPYKFMPHRIYTVDISLKKLFLYHADNSVVNLLMDLKLYLAKT